MRRTGTRFDDYREITAKFDTPAALAACGHDIKKGEIIGYASGRYGSRGLVQCAACWARWVAENREADAIEAGYMNSPW